MSDATIMADSIGGTRLKQIVCPRCGQAFPRWYKGTLRVGANYMTGMRLSGYRRLAEHLEEDHEGADDGE